MRASLTQISSRILSGVLLLAVSSACTKTKMTAIKDPDAPAAPYKRLLVVAAFSDLESRDRVENRFVKSLAQVGIDATGSMRVILPTRQYATHEDVRRAVEPTGADGILFLRVTEVTNQVDAVITIAHAFTPSSWIVGSYTIESSRMRSEVRLIDTQSGRTSWIGTARTESNRKSTTERMITSLAGTTADQLRDAQLVVPITPQ